MSKEHNPKRGDLASRVKIYLRNIDYSKPYRYFDQPRFKRAAANPLDIITRWMLTFFAGFIGLFIGTYILTLTGGAIASAIVNAITGTQTMTWGFTETTRVLGESFSFAGRWVPFMFECVQWVFWLFIGSWSGWVDNPFA